MVYSTCQQQCLVFLSSFALCVGNSMYTNALVLSKSLYSLLPQTFSSAEAVAHKCICLMMSKNLQQHIRSSARESRRGGPKGFSFLSGRLNRPGPCLEEAFVKVSVAKPTHVLQTSVWSFQGMHKGPQSARAVQQDAR